MQGYELERKVRHAREARPNAIFIKWWRNEEDWIDFDLVSRFLENLESGTDIAGFELIDQDEMWRTIERRCEGRAVRVEKDGTWVVKWSPPKDAEIDERLPEYPYSPETLLKILDVETNYNYVD